MFARNSVDLIKFIPCERKRYLVSDTTIWRLFPLLSSHHVLLLHLEPMMVLTGVGVCTQWELSSIKLNHIEFSCCWTFEIVIETHHSRDRRHRHRLRRRHGNIFFFLIFCAHPYLMVLCEMFFAPYSHSNVSVLIKMRTLLRQIHSKSEIKVCKWREWRKTSAIRTIPTRPRVTGHRAQRDVDLQRFCIFMLRRL